MIRSPLWSDSVWRRKNVYKPLLFGIWGIIILLSASVMFCGSAGAALDIKVGYYDYDGYLTVNENGRITGYAGELLDMLMEANTHWNFVPVKFSRGAFLENMRKGFAVVSVQSPRDTGSPKFFIYSEKPIGVEKGILYTGLDQAIHYEDYEAFDGMRVGTVTGDLQNSLFSDYQAKHGFTVEYVVYNSIEEIKQALQEREIDSLIYGSVVEQADLQIIARYAETPLHVAANEWGAMFIEYFDRVINRLYAEDPAYFDKLYEKYFHDAPKAIQAMTEAEELALAQEAERAAGVALAAQEAARKAAEEEDSTGKEDSVNIVDEPVEPEGQDKGGEKGNLAQLGFGAAIAVAVIVAAGTLIRNSAAKGKEESSEQIIRENEQKRDADIQDRGDARMVQTLTADAAAAEQAQVQAQEAALRAVEEQAQAQAQEAAQRAAAEQAQAQEREAAQRAAAEQAQVQAQEAALRAAEEQAQAQAQEAAQRAAAEQAQAQAFPGWIDAMAELEANQAGNGEGTEYTDDQIRGEIYLSGLTYSLQPRYSLDQNKIVGAEVFISCRHPIRDRVYPEELVLSLSQKGKLYILDRYVFESVCLYKPHEKAGTNEAFEIVIPVFTESVIRPDFAEWYIGAARNYGVPTSFFRLDLVYHWQGEQDQQIYRSLQTLTEAGFKLALKDVGMVNYPLGILSEVDIDALVIAEQLVVEALHNGKKKKLLLALKEMCGQMQIQLEADRIDSREKFQMTTDIGCQVFQGNFLTRAIPIDQFWDYKRRLDVRTA